MINDPDLMITLGSCSKADDYLLPVCEMEKLFKEFISQGLQTPAKKRVQLEFSPQLMILNIWSQDTKKLNQNLNKDCIAKFSNLLDNR